MQVIEVKNPEEAKAFLLFPVKLYANEKNWIRPLDKDENVVFDNKENKYFRHGTLTRWIVKDSQQNVVGRIAAFINKKTAKSKDLMTGGVGFFESIDNQEVANLLFDTAKNWLQENGMNSMDGPINFGERDKWWGLLVKGYDKEPNYCMHYHMPYYKALFEKYGFQTYFEQYTYHLPVDVKLPEIYAAKADRIARDSKYTFESIKKSQLAKYAEDFRTIYNKAWVKHTGVREMPKAQAMALMKQLKPVLDEDLIWFGYHDGTPVAFFIMIPELNQLFKYLNGDFSLWAKVKFMYHKLMGACKKMFGVAFGVVPEFQGKGLEGAIVMAAAKRIQPMGKYDHFEMNWIGDFNPKMMHICEQVGADIVKVHVTYRIIFDNNIPFERHPIID